MTKVPQRKSPKFKFQIALEALRKDKTIVQIASEHDMHPKQIQRWKDQLLQEGEQLFVHKTTQNRQDPDREQLVRVINQLSAELEYLKKKLRSSV